MDGRLWTDIETSFIRPTWSSLPINNFSIHKLLLCRHW